MEYDLIRLFDHPVCLFDYIAAAIVTFGPDGASQCAIDVEWRRSAGDVTTRTTQTLKWDLDSLRTRQPLIDRQIQALRERDENQGRRTEQAAIVVAAAVMAHLEPETRFTCVAAIGTSHDYYLNETRDEMIEVAGLWEGGLPGLFEDKRNQSEKNPTLRKRWVSVTIAREEPRNRTEGLHQ